MNAERDVALYSGEIHLPLRISGGKISARTDVAVLRVRRSHACTTPRGTDVGETECLYEKYNDRISTASFGARLRSKA